MNLDTLRSVSPKLTPMSSAYESLCSDCCIAPWRSYFLPIRITRLNLVICLSKKEEEH